MAYPLIKKTQTFRGRGWTITCPETSRVGNMVITKEVPQCQHLQGLDPELYSVENQAALNTLKPVDTHIIAPGVLQMEHAIDSMDLYNDEKFEQYEK